MSSYLDGLNDVQKQAVTTINGPVLVVAGPGSGKTRVLTFRIAYLIESGAKPWEILALTFTNKAAREMKARISKVVGNSADKVWAGTFHSIFARILRIESEHLGYPSNFTIYDSDDSKSAIRAIIKEKQLNKEHYKINPVRSRISQLKTKLISPSEYAKRDDLIEEDRQAKRPLLGEIYAQYTANCRRSGAMDFDDLLYKMHELLLNNEEVRKKYQRKFRYVLVDEFQDTNTLQYEIIRFLVRYENSPMNVCVVGDDAQSIYAFRGATIQNILDFEKDYKNKGIQVFKLEQNYRSTSHIVEAANEVIGHNRRQIKKEIWSDKGEGSRIKVLKALSDREEGKMVADLVLEQKNRHQLANSDFAILYRTNAQSRIFEEYLKNYRIDYRIFGGLSFYLRKEVKDAIAYLRLAINPNDDEALRRVINYPKRGIGQSSLDKIAATASHYKMSMWEVLGQIPLSTRTRSQLLKFKALIEQFQQKAATANASVAADFIIRQSGILKDLEKEVKTEHSFNKEQRNEKVDNLQSLLTGINEFVNMEPEPFDEAAANDPDLLPPTDANDKSLSAYLQDIALLTDADQNAQSDDYITLMSVHSAKGLEFKSVFVVGLEEDLFPSFMAKDSMDGLDEERRLFYVAITRSEAYLSLSFATSRYRNGSLRYNEPSRFLEEISPVHLETTAGLRRSGMGGARRPAGDDFPFGKSSAPARSSVRGKFPSQRSQPVKPAIDPKDFKPAPPKEIAEGQTVIHMKFGKGKVTNIDGNAANRIATIDFKGIDNPQRRLMLKFAKLMIVEE